MHFSHLHKVYKRGTHIVQRTDAHVWMLFSKRQSHGFQTALAVGSINLSNFEFNSTRKLKT